MRLRPLPTLLALMAAVVLATGIQAAGGRPAGEGPRRGPNVLFLLSDDQRPDTLGAAGNRLIRTPRLDALARSGTRFTRAVSPNPLCVPSRAEILTGCSGFRNGILPGFSGRLRPGTPFWAGTMRAAGYRTGYVGKWHSSGRPAEWGFDETEGLFGAGRGPVPRQLDARGREVTGYRGWVFQEADGRLHPEQGVGLTPDISRRFADAAIRFLRREDRRPFFLQVNFTAPHDPLLLPPDRRNRYDPRTMPLPGNFLLTHPFDHGQAWNRDEQLIPWPRTPEEVREDLALYYAVISDMDAQIGRILDALRAARPGQETVVIFASDHGLAMGSHGLRGKQNMYEHTVGVPLLVSGPGLPRGRVSHAQVYLRDLFPTACELAGIPVPAAVEGRSFAPVLRGSGPPPHDAVFGYFTDCQRMVRSDRWKLIYYPRIDRAQLFDLRRDPLERRDLAGEAAHRATREELRARLLAWQREIGDPLSGPAAAARPPL